MKRLISMHLICHDLYVTHQLLQSFSVCFVLSTFQLGPVDVTVLIHSYTHSSVNLITQS